MAVDAQHLNLFPPQILCNNRDLSLMNLMEGTGNVYSAGIAYGSAAAATAALAPKTMAETVMPMYGSAITESFPAKTAAATIKAADSGLTYALPPSVTAAGGCRKRSRDDNINPLLSFAAVARNHNHHGHTSSVTAAAGSPFTFLGEDISLQIQQQQFEIDRLIAQHNEKLRMEIEETSKRNSRRIIAAVEESVTKKLKAKDEEIEKINKLNWALEERVKTLCVENQMWRDLAQMNEATGNALRTNLEQVLAAQRQRQRQRQRQQQQQHGGDAAAVVALELADDAESCCGSNFDDEMKRRTLANGVAESRGDHCSLAPASNINGNGNDGCVNGNNKLCRSCGREESCVLLLPCRHLCLCTVCGSSLHVCPICKSPKTASLHVNF